MSDELPRSKPRITRMTRMGTGIDKDAIRGSVVADCYSVLRLGGQGK
jgi:hypothetical protein